MFAAYLRMWRTTVALLAVTLTLAATITGTRYEGPLEMAETLTPWVRPEPPFVLSDGLRAQLAAERYRPVHSVSGLPRAVRIALARLIAEPNLDMADPGEPFQASDVVGRDRLPWRRFIIAGVGSRHCFVQYEIGGLGPAVVVVVFRLRPAVAEFLWGGIAGFTVAEMSEWPFLLAPKATYTAMAYW